MSGVLGVNDCAGESVGGGDGSLVTGSSCRWKCTGDDSAAAKAIAALA